MIRSFSDLKRNSQAELEKLKETYDKPSFVRDERYWRPKLDQAGNGGAIIRFLPPPAGEENYDVRRITYSFKGPTGKWYIEPSPVSIELPDPVAELYNQLYNSGTEEGKERAKMFKRRVGYISNIFVVKHPANPEDEGKVFLFEYGTKIRKKLAGLMRPDESLGETPQNPFDPWEGLNLRLKVKKEDGFPNYDDSNFDKPGPFASEEIMERAWQSCHSLKAEIAPNKFKPYDELKKKLDIVMGWNTTQAPASAPKAETTQAPVNKTEPETPPWVDEGGEDNEDTLAFFQNLAKKRAG